MMFYDKNKGFTFIEILGVLAIIAILLSISTISFRHSQAKARDIVRKSDLQMIADALISYGNDHGHFPSSIYDNVNNGKAMTISKALNTIATGGEYQDSGLKILFYPDIEILKNILMLRPEDNLDLNMFDKTETTAAAGLGNAPGTTIYTLKDDISYPEDSEYEIIESIIKNSEIETPLPTALRWVDSMDYSIVTQGMCASSLRKYLVDEGYISTIPSDPSGESVNLQTNICFNGDVSQGFTANDTGWSIQTNNCYTKSNSGCTQLCKQGYVYVSDGIHFALIAHMESKNGGNYETTACGSCEIEGKCSSEGSKTSWTKSDQLPCDITDEFRNTFDCIQENGVVEYSTGEYYFYIY